LLIADSSGVVFVPQEKAQQVVTLAESLARQEEEMAQAILRGVMPSQVLGRRYETMLERDDQ
jgi:regulator of RNase E activity RraA